MPDKKWLKSEFLNMVPEGKAAFDSAWNELKNHEAQDYRTETHSEYKSEFDYEHDRRVKLNSEMRDQGVPLGERMKIFNAPYPGEE